MTGKILYNTCKIDTDNYKIRITMKIVASLSERKEKEMKEAYEAAEMEIIEFETEDVITSSGGEIGGGDEGFGD